MLCLHFQGESFEYEPCSDADLCSSRKGWKDYVRERCQMFKQFSDRVVGPGKLIVRAAYDPKTLWPSCTIYCEVKALSGTN